MFRDFDATISLPAQPSGFAPTPRVSSVNPYPVTHTLCRRNGSLSLEAEICSLFLHGAELTTRQISRALSALTKRPTLVVGLDAMPYAPTVRVTGNHFETPFKPRELAARAHYLAHEALEALPGAQKFWREWSWRNVSARICAPNLDECIVKGGPAKKIAASNKLPSRLVGECWNAAAVIFAPDQRWTKRQEWEIVTGLGDLLERHPAGETVGVYLMGHEVGHVLQRRLCFDDMAKGFKTDISIKREISRWLIEYDADKLPVTGMRQLAQELKKDAKAQNLQGRQLMESEQKRRDLLETSTVVKHMRALNGFLYATPRYWVALALDNPGRLGLLPEPRDKNDRQSAQAFVQAAERAAEKAILVGYELRWRVAAQLEGKPLTDNSAALQAKIKDWHDNSGPAQPGTHRWELNYWFSDILSRSKNAKTPDEPKRSFFWGEMNDVRQAIPALRDVLNSGAVTDPLTRRNGELVLQAACYFKPSLQLLSQQKQVQQPSIGDSAFPSIPAYQIPRNQPVAAYALS